jgi:hypothetical protein
LAIPNHSQPGTYWLTLSMHPCGEQAWLPIHGVEDAPLGESLTLNVPIEITVP